MSGLSERLDPYFQSIGIQPQSLGLGGRKYEGTYRGRELKANCSARQRTRYQTEDISRRVYTGHQFVVQLSTPLQTRLIVSQTSVATGWLARQINKRSGLVQLPYPGPGLDHLEVWAHDPEWAGRVLADEWFRPTILYALPADKRSPLMTFNLQPDLSLLSQRIHLNEINPEQAGYWVTALENLLQAAERLPAPSRTAKLSRFERWSRDNPGSTVGLFLGGIVAVVIAISLAMFVLVLIFILAIELLF